MVLLADEPTGNLDFDASLNVYSLIEEMTRKLQISTVVATHDLDLADRMDRTLNLKGGLLSFADAL
jgi:lipoprotein-releasing system ATP-binding protein